MLALSAVAERKLTRFRNALLEMEEGGRGLKNQSEMLKRIGEAMDNAIAEHGKRAGSLAFYTALKMGAGTDDAYKLFWCGLLHDACKMFVNGNFIEKPHKLEQEEMEEVRMHVRIVHLVADRVKWLAGVEDAMRYHHENWDGSGYPNGLKGEEIPLAARIVGVVDAFDAMVDGKREYKKPLDYDEAIAELERASGTQFDPNVVRAFVEMFGERNEAQKAE
ncbi:HD domain protein [Candidatus Anstonella stagnisolia]|nr:HD domain protein [Candidatus Anstonella stagnisolia]